MVRNKNNGNLQISFRLINEKQTNPRLESAGQNLVRIISIPCKQLYKPNPKRKTKRVMLRMETECEAFL